MPQEDCTCEGQNVVFGDYGKDVMGAVGTGDASGTKEPQFLPQPGDDIVRAPAGEMGPIGPWASGCVDWGPLGNLTGTRPVVDSYSITRYSEGEWRKHNHDILCAASEEQRRSNVTELNSREAMENIAAAADKKQHDNTLRLGQRAHEVLRWRTELERAIEDMITEIDLLEEQRRRARQAKTALCIVKNIAKECLSRRAKRMEPDLVRDEAEEELIKEAALVKEVEDLIDRTLIQIEEQQARNKAIKARMEDDWSDKKQTYQIAAINTNLTIKSRTILLKPGATRFPESQSTPAGWEDNVKDILQTAQEVKGQSCELRALLDGPILSDCVRDLRAQADRVEQALARRVRETDLCRQALENELAVVVRRIAETEKLIGELKAAIRAMDAPMKKAQTRLDNRLHRPRTENCRDKPQFGLVEEVKTIADQVSCLQARLKEAEDALVRLYTTRGHLEREIQIKRNTLYIDKDRCQVTRAHYPSSTALAGYA
ncbi:tektin-4-like [Macrosteles quadrilineatus]|uniref:tektin-4-like n=1 Tax=Macrosteles quadrilineatus TaxID=74068 RepID=UPI0023E1362B|nr:tektin-4-like [Macrosteles quadrilineatus]